MHLALHLELLVAELSRKCGGASMELDSDGTVCTWTTMGHFVVVHALGKGNDICHHARVGIKLILDNSCPRNLLSVTELISEQPPLTNWLATRPEC